VEEGGCFLARIDHVGVLGPSLRKGGEEGREGVE